MHQKNESLLDEQKREHKVSKDEHDQIISNEAEKVVNDIIDNLICIKGEEDGIDSSVTLEEISSASTDMEGEKEYCNVCDKCDYKIVANRKYVALQLLKEHTNEHHIKTCSECNYKAQNLQDMKRHGRDIHGIMTGSTSPPAKRKRKQRKVSSDNSVRMDIDDENVLNLSLQIEDMEVEMHDNQTFEKRSNLMDEKVAAKQKRMGEEERKRDQSKKAMEKEKNAEKLANIEKIRKLNKSRKMKNKTTKKIINKKKKREMQTECKVNYTVPNIKEVPLCCQHLVDKGDVVYVVPGDGACGPNCASAFFFHDRGIWPQIA